jgi:hypothetical protein
MVKGKQIITQELILALLGTARTFNLYAKKADNEPRLSALQGKSIDHLSRIASSIDKNYADLYNSLDKKYPKPDNDVESKTTPTPR